MGHQQGKEHVLAPGCQVCHHERHRLRFRQVEPDQRRRQRQQHAQGKTIGKIQRVREGVLCQVARGHERGGRQIHLLAARHRDRWRQCPEIPPQSRIRRRRLQPDGRGFLLESRKGLMTSKTPKAGFCIRLFS